jgi:glycosyltransferase involved in cell wall biosynthesis
VFWRGYKNTLSEIYDGIDVIVAPSIRIEAFGLMACEANMFSIPAVVTNRGGQAEIIKDGFNGFVIDPLNPVDIADKLQIFYNDSELLSRMGTNGRQRVIEKFSVDQMNFHLHTLIQNLE